MRRAVVAAGSLVLAVGCGTPSSSRAPAPDRASLDAAGGQDGDASLPSTDAPAGGPDARPDGTVDSDGSTAAEAGPADGGTPGPPTGPLTAPGGAGGGVHTSCANPGTALVASYTALTFQSTPDYQVNQRQPADASHTEAVYTDGYFRITLSGILSNGNGTYSATPSCMEITLQTTDSAVGLLSSFTAAGSNNGWVSNNTGGLNVGPAGGNNSTFYATFDVPAGLATHGMAPYDGFYRLYLRPVQTGSPGASTLLNTHFGVGDVYVVTGQSNAGPNGDEPQAATSGSFGALTEATGLQPFGHLALDDANIYQPGGLVFSNSDSAIFWTEPSMPPSTTGSYWPLLGDMLFAVTDVPAEFIIANHGGTQMKEWGTTIPCLSCADTWVTHDADGNVAGPVAFLQDRLVNVLTHLKAGQAPLGPKAVLWHQGEAQTGNPVSAILNYTTPPFAGAPYNAGTTTCPTSYDSLPTNGNCPQAGAYETGSYAGDLAALINNVRARTGLTSLPYLVSEVSYTSSGCSSQNASWSEMVNPDNEVDQNQCAPYAYRATWTALTDQQASIIGGGSNAGMVTSGNVYLGAQTDQFHSMYRRYGTYGGYFDFLHFTNSGGPFCAADGVTPGTGTRCNGLKAVAGEWSIAIQNAFFGGQFPRLP